MIRRTALLGWKLAAVEKLYKHAAQIIGGTECRFMNETPKGDMPADIKYIYPQR